jgi:hypothetical protein
MDSHERTVRGLQGACLSLFPGLGHLYIGERKGFKILGVSLLLMVVTRSWWGPALIVYAGLVVWSAADTFLIVKRGRTATKASTTISTPANS